MSLIARARRFFEERLDASLLARVRIAIGVAAVLKGGDLGLIYAYGIAGAPLAAPYLPGIPQAAWDVLPVLLALWLVVAVCLAVGLFSRTSALTLAALGAYLLALDQRLYANHLYLLALICLLLGLSGCGQRHSLDARRRRLPGLTPRWPVELLKLQLSMVYGFGAVAKINSAFLSGEVLAGSLRWSGVGALGPALDRPAILAALAVAVIALELFLAFGLWLRRLRPSAFALGFGLHLFIVLWVGPARLQLLIFAIESLALYLLFLGAEPGADLGVRASLARWPVTRHIADRRFGGWRERV